MTGEMFGHMAEEDLRRLVSLLEDARSRCGDLPHPPTCDGKPGSDTCAAPDARNT
jgi:hypothetical protein